MSRPRHSPHLGVPQLASLVERAGNDFVPPRVVEGDRVDDVAMSVQRQQLVPRAGVPNLAGGGGWRGGGKLVQCTAVGQHHLLSCVVPTRDRTTVPWYIVQNSILDCNAGHAAETASGRFGRESRNHSKTVNTTHNRHECVTFEFDSYKDHATNRRTRGKFPPATGTTNPSPNPRPYPKPDI